MKIDILKSFRYKLVLRLILEINKLAYNMFIFSKYINCSKLNLHHREDILLNMDVWREPNTYNLSRYLSWHKYLFESGWSATEGSAQLCKFRSLQKSISENGFLTDDCKAITATWVLIVVYITPDQKITLGFNSYLLREGAHRLAYAVYQNIDYSNVRMVKPSEYVYPRFVGL